ncbi:hypothetical protein POJ06DRAFT_263905 [Lipomyces tetrasporus]|uniref:Uncharacterized protein n=1 Tax=Lipomyces tetrasporus TaxID=54092 RepID=A0AAD7QJX7_9ASCO|nr:uncharacterized protein POJ06DRAFT_263905 [Lipomyces tetrasporus]KAJ8096574.1 hypothetical protein POJ06DRAFT_263905 [Lipomyces tetrasporus]
MASMFEVPPRRTHPGPVTKTNIDPNKPVFTAREYSDLFWYTDGQLTKKDRRDIVSELNQEWAFRVIGSFVGGISTAIVTSIAMKRYFPATRMSMTAFGAIVGTDIGNEAGYMLGYRKAMRDFEARPNCRTIIRLVDFRPTLGLWINYYSYGKPKGIFSTWWRDYQLGQIGNTKGSYDEKMADEDSEAADRVPDEVPLSKPEPVAPSSWGIPVQSHVPTEENVSNYNRARYQKSRREVDAEFYNNEHVETQDEFDTKIEMERKGQDQPDDFSTSERRYSRSKYD